MKTYPSIETFQKICAVFNITLDSFVPPECIEKESKDMSKNYRETSVGGLAKLYEMN